MEMNRQIIHIKEKNPALNNSEFEEVVRFFGKRVGFYENGIVKTTLYVTPAGYRVLERDRVTERTTLLPYTNGPSGTPFPLSERVYGTFTQAQVVAGYPLFAKVAGDAGGARDV